MEKVADHFLVSKHEIVPLERLEEVFKKFGSKAEKFPQILVDDPAVEEIGAKRGDMIKITRKSQTAGTSIYFRIVV
ncbi:MAG TPA: DNA-directed RNA polymerase subunit H [archaeon]|nr:DNA-directed RNA polymerase subunit H [archaeon]